MEMFAFASAVRGYRVYNLMLNDEKTEFLIIGTRQQLAKVNINCISCWVD